MIDLHTYAKLMPKAELHVHLEGSIRPSTLLQLAERNRIQLPYQNITDLQEFYHFKNFSHFVNVYITITNCLRTVDDYRLIAYEFGCDCARQNIRYSEVTFTIETNQRLTRLPWQLILEGLNSGRAQAEKEFGITWRWVFDISRENHATRHFVLETALASRPKGVVAFGLGGNEADFPPELYIDVFEQAKRSGIPRVPHAGETLGPTSVWTAINKLHADRIGHGVRSIEDSRLIAFLLDSQIPLEICPTSNIKLGVYSNYGQHPLRKLWDQGLLITINSDDPPMFDTDLVREYQILVDYFNFSIGELEQVSLNALRSSFLEQAQKEQMIAIFQSEFNKLKANV
jgi:adenosine deaminase